MGSRVKTPYYQIVQALSSKYPISSLLRAAKLSRSGFYKWRCTQRIDQTLPNRNLQEQICIIYSKYPFYGYRRITAALHRSGLIVNHKRVYRLMKKLKLQSIIRKKRRYFGRKGSSVFPNVLDRNFASQTARQKLVTDVTYLPVKEGFIYLSAVQDLYNNEIVSYKIGKRNSLSLVLETIEPLKKMTSEEAVLHSDQGFQYTSKLYKKKLEEMGIQGSHSRKGNCLDNACIESFFSHFKTETLSCKATRSEKEMRAVVEKYITFYNNQRFQKKFGQLSPIEYREKLAA